MCLGLVCRTCAVTVADVMVARQLQIAHAGMVGHRMANGSSMPVETCIDIPVWIFGSSVKEHIGAQKLASF